MFASLPVIQCLEQFNKALEGSDVPVSGIIAAAEVTTQNLKSLRCDQGFKEVFEATQQILEQFQLERVTLPFKRKLRKKLDAGATPEYTANSAEELCDRVYFVSH